MLDSRNFVIRTLIADGAIKDADVKRATEHSMATGGDLVESLVAMNLVTSRRVAIARAKLCEYPFVDIAHYEIDIHNASFMPRAVAERLVAFPLFVIDGTATVAMLDPLNLQAIDQIRQILKMDVEPVLSDVEQLRSLITRAYSLNHVDEDSVSQAEEHLTSGEEPIVAAVNQILFNAIDTGASDVHLNPHDNDLHLRVRIDGSLRVLQGPSRSAHAAIVQRLKVMARLDLTQTRRPQDGKFRFIRAGEAVDIRLSIVPTIYGENVVMRILRSANKLGTIDDLGMREFDAAAFKDLIAHPHGMILVTGPTGSGKTTTLYTALNMINSPARNIMTIEDPVEIRLPMVRQIQVNHEIGVNFSTALRAVLRQDPDVILVGEIRDEETAKITVQSALTGHLVLSTLHTNDAVGALPRLRDFGIPHFGINAALLGVVAQRLARCVCESCARPESLESIKSVAGVISENATFRIGKGCSNCGQTGTKGRAGIFEIMRMTTSIQSLVEGGAATQELRRAAKESGMRSLYDEGIEKAARGLIPITELTKLRSIIDTDQNELEISRDAMAGIHSNAQMARERAA